MPSFFPGSLGGFLFPGGIFTLTAHFRGRRDLVASRGGVLFLRSSPPFPVLLTGARWERLRQVARQLEAGQVVSWELVSPLWP